VHGVRKWTRRAHAGRAVVNCLSSPGRAPAPSMAGRAAAAGPQGEARRGRRAAGSGQAGGGAKRRP
jgi:hypothetical protein